METFKKALIGNQSKRGWDVEMTRGIFRKEINAGNLRQLTPNDAETMLIELYPEMVHG